MSKTNKINYSFKSKFIRQEIFKTALKAKKGHIPPAYSWVENAVVLFYTKIFNFFKKKDIFILSKGHGCLTLYVVLADLGLISKKSLYSFGGDGSLLPGHPDTKINKIENCSGSLGHGLGVACGKSLSLKMRKSSNHVIVLLGDGECQEGSIWEACIFAAHNKLNNLIAIIDRNKLSATNFTEKIGALEPLDKKFKSFGWNTFVINGHNYNDIYKTFKKAKKSKKPVCIISNTIKGKGIKFMENKKEWHHQIPNKKQILTAMKELKIDKLYE
jgi:transketolase